MNVIETRQLCKSYSDLTVLHDVTMHVEQGKLVGFLGPNGAGKTTTIRILLGLLSSDSGVATLFGQPCHADGKKLRRNIGYLPGDVHFYPNIKGRSTLEFFARTRKQNCTRELLRLAERFRLPLNKTVRSYSTGMKQKLGLIQALMHKPNLLILDEPTSGLDPLVRKEVFGEIRDVIQEGRTVLFSSHSLDEVEALCDEVIILRGGRIIEHQQISKLREKALRRVEIEFRNDPPPDLPKPLNLIEQNDRKLRGTWTGHVTDFLAWLQKHEISDCIIERPDLNDLFMAYYSDHE